MKKILGIVLVSLMCLVVSSCNEHQNNVPYDVKVISKCDSVESRVVVIYTGKTSMPMRQWQHCYYMTIQYRGLSEPNTVWSPEMTLGVSSDIYEKYKVDETYRINGHTHIVRGDSIPQLCWHSF